MSPMQQGNLRLEITPASQATGPLFPEQSAEFNVFLRNTGPDAVSAIRLDGDFSTPAYSLFDAAGKEIGRFTQANLVARAGFDLGTKSPPVAEMGNLPPGRADQTKFNAWNFVRPYPPGGYAVQVSHRLSAGGPMIASERLPFQIAKAHVASAAPGYDNPSRSSSVLAWLASSHAAEENLRLLVRLSTPKGYSFLLAGATTHGDFPAGSRVAVAQIAPGVSQGVLGWLAVASARQAILIRHNLTYPYWRSSAIPLPIDHPLPVPRFPDLGTDAIFLATGASANGASLVGVTVNQPKGVTAQWTVPLLAAPVMTACALRLKRLLSVLLVVNHQSGSQISRIDVTLEGKVVSPEKVVRSSPDTVVAVAPGMDPASGSFVAMETQSSRPDRYALVRIPLSGGVQAGGMQEFRTWPVDIAGAPVSPRSFFVEELSETAVGFAFTGPDGEFGAGRIAPKPTLSKFRGRSESATLFPHLASLKSGITPACFTAEGRLFIAGEPF
jgi:hypothetical protein